MAALPYPVWTRSRPTAACSAQLAAHPKQSREKMRTKVRATNVGLGRAHPTGKGNPSRFPQHELLPLCCEVSANA